MLGWIIGTLCLIGFAKVTFGHSRWRRWHHAGWHHGGGHYGGWHRHGCGGGGDYPGPWMPRGLYFAFQRLGTSPGQEKAIRSALEQARDAIGAVRPNLKEVRTELAGAFAQEHFDPSSVDAVWSRHEGEFAKLRQIVSETLASIHAVLDSKQREQLAHWMRMNRGPGYGC